MASSDRVAPQPADAYAERCRAVAIRRRNHQDVTDALQHPNFRQEHHELIDRLAREYKSQSVRAEECNCEESVPFPIWHTIQIGTHQSAREILWQLKEWDARVTDEYLPSIRVAKRNREVPLVCVSNAELGFPNGCTARVTYSEATKQGLRFCQPEYILQLALQFGRSHPVGLEDGILLAMRRKYIRPGYTKKATQWARGEWIEKANLLPYMWVSTEGTICVEMHAVEEEHPFSGTQKWVFLPPDVPSVDDGANDQFQIWIEVEIGTHQTGRELYNDLLKTDTLGLDIRELEIMIYALEMSQVKRRVKLVKVTNAQLGFQNGCSIDLTYTAATAAGLRLCTPETGAQLCRQYRSMAIGESVLVASPGIVGKNRPLVFKVEGCLGGRELSGEPGINIREVYGPEVVFVFEAPE